MNRPSEVGKLMVHLIEFNHLTHYDTGKSGIVIPIALLHQTQSVDVEANLDTGASHCIFERFYGEALGLNVEAGERLEFSTATGRFVAFGHALVLTLNGFEFELVAYFAQDPLFNRNVLGRNGFLNRTLLGLDDYAGTLYLSRNS
jgi:hypothetical protein